MEGKLVEDAWFIVAITAKVNTKKWLQRLIPSHMFVVPARLSTFYAFYYR
jgi:hypothetical protein